MPFFDLSPRLASTTHHALHMSFIHYLRKTFDWRSRYIGIWELPLLFSSLSPPDPILWDQSFSPADGGIDFKRIQVSWCLQTTHLLFYLILEVLFHSKQISNFLVVDLKERCLKRTKSYLTFFIYHKPEVCTPSSSPSASAVPQISA